MSDSNIEALKASASEAKQKAETAGGTDAALNQLADEAAETLRTAEAALLQDPLEIEKQRIEKERKAGKHTKLEKAEFAAKKIAEQIAFLKGESVVNPEDDDDAPVTRGELKKIQAEQVEKSALELAEAITDSAEKELVIHHLKNSIKSTGKPEEDLRLAYSIVFSTKNGQVAEELARAIPARAHPSGHGAPPKLVKAFEPTPHEQGMMIPPFNLTQKQIEAIRKTEAEGRS